MRIEFTVNGRPPKKHGEKSMWARNNEAPFIFSLRKEAFKARSRAGLDDCLRSLIALELTIFAPKPRVESIGDLDNFITGVCDGLQAADSKVLPFMHEIFLEPTSKEIDPKNPLLFENDAKIMSIIAKKVALNQDQEIHYKVVIETIQ